MHTNIHTSIYTTMSGRVQMCLKIMMMMSLAVGMSMCSASVPDDATLVDKLPDIYPDYADVTISQNIAPLNFTINEAGDEYVTRISTAAGDGFNVKGKTLDINVNDWHALLESAQGQVITAEVFVRNEGKWTCFKPVKMTVAEKIDPYISYRLLEPSYVNYEVMRINQRNLENFDEKEIFNNCPFSDDTDGQCINCHSYQNYNADGTMQMHIRANKGGTLIVHNGEVKKVDLKRPETISAGAYPAWHPTLPMLAYSNNLTRQDFHHANPNKIEVYDKDSDLMLYYIDTEEVIIAANDTAQLETFPAWSPDGETLYYMSAPLPGATAEERSNYVVHNYRDVKYDIYSMKFDAARRTFSAPDTVYCASADGKSAALPRVSPDGKWLLFSMAEYGTFHIWHHDADLYVMNLATGDVRSLSAANSTDTESYHSWSSNGRWILFSSRRDDGSYTRLYISYFDADGNAHKPLMLPQRSPQHNLQLMQSYNVPEFMVAPVNLSRSQIITAINE